MIYAFQLGREPLLSVMELDVVCRARGIASTLTVLNQSVALVEADDMPNDIIDVLGGSIKFGRLIKVIDGVQFMNDALNILSSEAFIQEAFGEEESIAFAFSAFGEVPSGFQKKLKPLAISWKKFLKGRFRHVRFVESKDETTSSVTVSRNKLLRGCDLWMVFAHGQVYAIKTLDVQDYRSFSDRDFGRPRRNAKNGMLPPKLARIMVNLSDANSLSVLHDPFVGSGTILQEAGLLGVQNLIGTDIDPQNISDAEANLEWLKERTDKHWTVRLVQADIRTLTSLAYSDVTHVVAEIDLGDPLTQKATTREVSNRITEAEQLVQVLFTYAVSLSKCVALVVALPFWPQSDGKIGRVPYVIPSGFTQLKAEQYAKTFPRELSPRGGFDYIRQDQFVGREIVVIGKSK